MQSTAQKRLFLCSGLHKTEKALLKCAEHLRCKELCIITWDEECIEESDGLEIKVVPIGKWLLDLSDRGIASVLLQTRLIVSRDLVFAPAQVQKLSRIRQRAGSCDPA